MKTVFNNDMVKHVWAQMKQNYGSNSSGSFSFNGGELVSYNTAVALHYGDFVLRSADSFSPTTAKHLPSSYDLNVPVIDVVSVFSFNRRFHSKEAFPSGGTIKKDLLKQLLDLSVEYPKKRTEWTRGHVVHQIQTALDNLRFVCNRFGLKYPAGYSSPADVLASTEKAVAKVKAAQKREAAKQRKKAEALKAKDKAEFEEFLEGRSRYCPLSYRRDKTHYLTVVGDTVYTSGAASAPVSHAKVALALYRRVMRSGKAWFKNGERCRLGHFDLDSIDKDGNAAAGCHRFSAEEIKRFSDKWGF